MSNERYPRGFRERPRIQHEVWENTVPAQGTGGSASTRKVKHGATWVRGGTLAIVPTDAPVVYVRAPEAGTIVKVDILTAGGTGSCVVDIWKDTYANFPPTVGDSICSSAKPTISSGSKYESTSFGSWTTTSVAAGDVIAFKLDSCSTFTLVTCTLTLEVS